MIYIVFDLCLPITENLRLYEKTKDRIIQILNNIYNGLIHKNGTRKKAYYYGREKIYIKIQRIVINKKTYIDIFPLLTFPGSRIPLADYIDYSNDIPYVIKRNTKTLFETWSIKNQIDFLSLKGFTKYMILNEVVLYISDNKIDAYSSNKRKNIKKREPNYIFIIKPI